ncbi:uncharacterized protein FRV6_15496 [Fusarium oxysporum]|uniref:Metallo-beta-lactamase domain-containing protein n=1 Tax=Fusarium oxysporum TaxID=5507 RepID=A0A2H3TRV5_FUSOX|nr:uncharacterized protein FRV6_15496 [Fusarium oxysporum]
MGSQLPLGFVSIHALESGWFSMPERYFVFPLKDPKARKQVPSLSFLIQHYDVETSKMTKILFDLGLRRDIEQYPPPIRKHVATREPIDTSVDTVASLAKGGLEPDDIDFIFLSHLHWDHCGTPSDFETSEFIVGNGAMALLSEKPTGSSHNHFESNLLPLDRTFELKHPTASPCAIIPEVLERNSLATQLQNRKWRPMGPFPYTLDVFDDGSLYIVWAPGHLAGHINLLCRKKDKKYVYLAGDAGHDLRLLSGEKDIAWWRDENHQTCCIHQNPDQARQTLANIRAAWNNKTSLGPVEVVLAHDAAWASAAKTAGSYFPGEL